MKKLLLISMLFAIYSCEKCKTCTTTITTTVNSPGVDPTVSTTTADYCDDDLKNVEGKTTTAEVTMQGITATSVSKTVCR